MKSKLKNLFLEDFSIERALVLGTLLGLTTFWNGSMVLGSLMLLAGAFLFSNKRIELLIIALLSLSMSLLMTHFFVGSSASVKPQIWLGMLSKGKDLKSIAYYYLLLFGLMPLLYFSSFFIAKKNNRILLLIFIIPFIFANVVQITPDINANHKFILVFQIATALSCALVINLMFSYQKRILSMLAILLIFSLTCTGLYDSYTFYKLNTIKQIHYDQDPLKLWVMNNTNRQAIFLTPMVATHPILMAGRNIYFGWPYFAWSAGYNVPERMEKYKNIYLAKTLPELQNLLKNTSIDYILHEPRFMTDMDWQSALYYKIFNKVYQELDSRVIYQVPKEWSH